MMKKFVFDGLSYAKNVIDDHNIDEKNANEHMMLLAKYNFHAKKMDDTSNYHSIIQYTHWFLNIFTIIYHFFFIHRLSKRPTIIMIPNF